MTDSCDQSGSEQLIELGALSMSSAREGAVHTVSLFGELDVGTTDRVDAELQRVEATDAWMIVVDLSGLTFISSTGVQLLVDAEVRLAGRLTAPGVAARAARGATRA